MNAKYLEAHRALEKKLAAVNADARELLASGAKVGKVVKLIDEAKTIIATRGGEIKKHLADLKAAQQQQQQPPPPAPPAEPTKAEYLAEFAKLDAKGLKKTRESIEAALKEDPERPDAKLALEALNEVANKSK